MVSYISSITAGLTTWSILLVIIWSSKVDEVAVTLVGIVIMGAAPFLIIKLM